MKVRKKPVVIDAVRYDGNGKLPTEPAFAALETKIEDGDLWIKNSLENCFVRCPVGHWILRGVRGEFYPCEPMVMAETYEPMLDEDELA